MKVLVATEKPFAAAAVPVEGIKKEIEGAGNEWCCSKIYREGSASRCSAVGCGRDDYPLYKADAEVLDAAKNLKIIVRAGAGYDNIDLAAATADNVVAERLLVRTLTQ